jgi:hypothetical protein
MSIDHLKLEHEEQRGFITKLTAKRTKLLEEISTNKTLLQKYGQIKDQVKIDKSVAADKKEDGIFPGEEFLSEIKISKDTEKSSKG